MILQALLMRRFPNCTLMELLSKASCWVLSEMAGSFMAQPQNKFPPSKFLLMLDAWQVRIEICTHLISIILINLCQIVQKTTETMQVLCESLLHQAKYSGDKVLPDELNQASNSLEAWGNKYIWMSFGSFAMADLAKPVTSLTLAHTGNTQGSLVVSRHRWQIDGSM